MCCIYNNCIDRFLNKYRIATVRARWHNYNTGRYFITICTNGREHYFGEITDGEMHFSVVGEYASTCIGQIESLHNGVFVPVYVVMPDHIHLVVIVDEIKEASEILSSTEEPLQCDDSSVEPPQCDDSSVEPPQCDGSTVPQCQGDTKMRVVARRCGRLSHIISRFKYAVTRFANLNSITFAWQTRFYDRIIRNQEEMKNIVQYIDDNVAKWRIDSDENPV